MKRLFKIGQVEEKHKGLQNMLILCPLQQHLLYKFSDRVYSGRCVQRFKEPTLILDKGKEERLTEAALNSATKYKAKAVSFKKETK